MLLPLAYPLKIRLNSLQEFGGFSFAVLPVKPFNRIAMFFAAITRKAGGQNILRRISRIVHFASGYRYPMIDSYLHTLKQSLLLTTIGATVVPIIQTELPIFCGESCWQISFSRAATAISRDFVRRIRHISFAFTNTKPLRISQTFLLLFSVLSHMFGAYFVRVILLIFLLGCFDLFRILLAILASACRKFFPMSHHIASRCFTPFCGVKHLVFATFCPDAYTAWLSNSPLFRPIKKGLRWKIFVPALAATLKGVWIVDHSAPRYAVSYGVCGQGSTSAAFSRSYSLDHIAYFTLSGRGAQ